MRLWLLGAERVLPRDSATLSGRPFLPFVIYLLALDDHGIVRQTRPRAAGVPPSFKGFGPARGTASQTSFCW